MSCVLSGWRERAQTKCNAKSGVRGYVLMVGVLITVGLDLFLRSKVHGRVKVLGMGELPMELGYFSRRIMGDAIRWSGRRRLPQPGQRPASS